MKLDKQKKLNRPAEGPEQKRGKRPNGSGSDPCRFDRDGYCFMVEMLINLTKRLLKSTARRVLQKGHNLRGPDLILNHLE